MCTIKESIIVDFSIILKIHLKRQPLVMETIGAVLGDRDS